jgi:hypothetical protein
MPFSSGKKAVIFNRADSWDFSSYREGDGNALPLFDKEKVASSSLLALAPLLLKYLGWHSGFNLEPVPGLSAGGEVGPFLHHPLFGGSA